MESQNDSQVLTNSVGSINCSKHADVMFNNNRQRRFGSFIKVKVNLYKYVYYTHQKVKPWVSVNKKFNQYMIDNICLYKNIFDHLFLNFICKCFQYIVFFFKFTNILLRKWTGPEPPFLQATVLHMSTEFWFCKIRQMKTT